MNNTTPLKAIKQWCFECSGRTYKEVRLCPNTHCPLYCYRFGKNPKMKGRSGGNPEIYKLRNSATKQEEQLNT